MICVALDPFAKHIKLRHSFEKRGDGWGGGKVADGGEKRVTGCDKT